MFAPNNWSDFVKKWLKIAFFSFFKLVMTKQGDQQAICFVGQLVKMIRPLAPPKRINQEPSLVSIIYANPTTDVG